MTWRRATSEDRLLAAVWAAGSVSFALLAPWAERIASAVPPCALKTLAGIPCLTCGATRAATALAGGDVAHALALNPLVAAAMLGWVAGGPLTATWVTLRGSVPRVPGKWPASWRIGVASLLALDWIYVALRGS